MKLTLAQVKPVVARVLGKHQNSADVLQYINEAQERLMNRGNWRGTVMRYRIVANDSKITWPRQIETILKCSVDGGQTPVANHWYEFAGQGPGIINDEEAPGMVLEDMGEACSFDDIEGLSKKLYVISDEAEDADAEIQFKFYDDSNKWVRTLDGTEFINGEKVALGATGAYTTNICANLVSVIKPVTNGTVYLYEYDVATATNKPLAIYEPDETNPVYRRSRIPLLSQVDSSGTFDGCPEGYAVVDVIAKLRHLPVADDDDEMLIGNLPALKDMVMSIVKAEKNLVQETEYYEGRAIRELEKELGNYNGGTTHPVFDTQDPQIWGAGSIQGVI
jgi:hypothetical protein